MYVTSLGSGTIYSLPFPCIVNDPIKVRKFPDTSGFTVKSKLSDKLPRRLPESICRLVQKPFFY